MNRKTIALLVVSTLAVAAFGKTSFMKVFQETYGIKAGSKIATAKCSVCHIGAKGPKLNAYGDDLKKANGGAKVKTLTADLLKAAGKLSAAGDGKSNDSKIQKDKLPAEK